MMTTERNMLSYFNEFRKWIILILVAIVLFLGYQYFTKKEDSSTVEYDTALIEQQIKNVGKLVVTEGHFAEVLTYKDNKKYLGNLIAFEKKALVIVNADVTVGFDLSLVKYDIDSINKVVNIVNIPKEEIKISTDLKYYDTESSRMNEFTGDDYNKIAKIAKANIAKKVESSSLKKNAKNRFVSELSKLLIVTKSMGWKLQYDGEAVNDDSDLDVKIKG
ncbi:DUF4230 domain-containing protein [Flavobacterium algicola]|uniref:DUF4230 domain-containing protein n=1 Tax=Flavobacterium algicola TaxID=556529 RepID=UPI001EFCEEF8|nr:DUF4230 domain-containing protein [Flavobacterium algicola]MCG9791287.1 DUF4230 domain-containing protein [Flavobacterium algicola]